MPNPSELQGMGALPLLGERFVLIGAPSQLDGSPQDWPLAEVLQRPLPEPDRAHDLRKLIERRAATAGLAPDVRYELDSPAMLIAVVKAGLALAARSSLTAFVDSRPNAIVMAMPLVLK